MKNQKSLRIFILADDAWHGSMLEQSASLNPDYEVKLFNNAETFFQQLHEQPDVVALDLPLPGLESLDVLRRIKSEQPRIKVVVISGKEESPACVQLLKQGAFECIVKDDHVQDRLWNTLLHLQEIISLRQELAHLKAGPELYELNGHTNGHANVNGNSLSHLFVKESSLREYECQIIQYYLEKYNKDVLLVAKKLDIGKSTIYRMIQNGEIRKGVA
ncbi:MAG TPA: response regulator [Chitinophagaceae bacterium]